MDIKEEKTRSRPQESNSIKCNVSEGHIYLLREREFVNTGVPIYKIGYSQDVFRRIKEYPKGSKVYLTLYVPDCKEFERTSLHVSK